MGGNERLQKRPGWCSMSAIHRKKHCNDSKPRVSAGVAEKGGLDGRPGIVVTGRKIAGGGDKPSKLRGGAAGKVPLAKDRVPVVSRVTCGRAKSISQVCRVMVEGIEVGYRYRAGTLQSRKLTSGPAGCSSRPQEQVRRACKRERKKKIACCIARI